MKTIIIKIIKGVLIVLGILLLLFAILIGAFIYNLDYRQRVVDRSQSNNGKYKLTLKSIGEPIFFGPASGRIELQKDGSVVSKLDFEAANDGVKISTDTWKVFWDKEFVAIRISGDEQNDELIMMDYNGEVSQYQLSTRFGEPFVYPASGDNKEIEAYAREHFPEGPEWPQTVQPADRLHLGGSEANLDKQLGSCYSISS